MVALALESKLLRHISMFQIESTLTPGVGYEYCCDLILLPTAGTALGAASVFVCDMLPNSPFLQLIVVLGYLRCLS